jgi:hypothetical protein
VSAALPGAALILGLAAGSLPAAGQGDAPPHETPPPAEPPTGGHPNLAEAATNPIANLLQVQVQNQFNWENHGVDGYSNAAIIQPVVPVKLPWASMPIAITRTTLPYVTTPDFAAPLGRQDGLGDLLFLGLGVPKLETKGVMVGVGPTVSFPTATDDTTGTGKWSAGPAALYINMRTKGLQWGILGWQLWSFAGDSDRKNVSQLSVQPFLVKHFSKGWYAGTQDVPWTYDFNAKDWTVPLGVKVGRVTRIGKRPINAFIGVYGNPVDTKGSPAWTAKVGISFLFPK